MSKFITFEGVEGSGKSTQSKKLQQYLTEKNIPNILTREPGGSEAAEEIRQLLISGAADKMDGLCETMLNFAARHDHIEKTIKPALKEGKIVICDRFFDSTLAYQGFAHGVDLDLIRNIQTLSIGDFKPDITFLIDLDIDAAFERIKNRAENNRYEQMDIGFHKKVREGFLKIAEENKDRIAVIDGAKSEDEIAQLILSRI
jgi:dTMP kinase